VADLAEQPARQVTIAEAAAVLGISEHAVRRRIKAGELAAARVERPQGYAYLVTLRANGHHPSGGDGGDLAPGGATWQPARNGHQVAPGRGRRERQVAPESAGLLRALELVASRDTALAERDGRIADLERERFELAGRLGYFQAELEHARATIKALEAPKEPIAPPPPAGAIFRPPPAEADPPRRPWWRFW
jgi:excisionase family DNA binding protein